MSRNCGHFHSYSWPSPFNSFSCQTPFWHSKRCPSAVLLQVLLLCSNHSDNVVLVIAGDVCNTQLSRDNFVFDVAASQLVGWLISCFWNCDEWLSGILTPQPQPTGRWCCVHRLRHTNQETDEHTNIQHVRKSTHTCTHRHTRTHSHTDP